MSGTWSVMLDAEERANDPAWAFETWKRGKQYAYGRVGRDSFAAGVRWVLDRQQAWDSLTEREAIRELRNPDSIFRPLYEAGGGTIWADCPRDGRITVGTEGFCDRCGFDFTA